MAKGKIIRTARPAVGPTRDLIDISQDLGNAHARLIVVSMGLAGIDQMQSFAGRFGAQWPEEDVARANGYAALVSLTRAACTSAVDDVERLVSDLRALP